MENQTKIFRSLFPVILVGLFTLSSVGCSKKQKSDEITPTTELGSDQGLGDSDSGRALGLVSINFPYDSFSLDSAAKTALKNNERSPGRP